MSVVSNSHRQSWNKEAVYIGLILFFSFCSWYIYTYSCSALNAGRIWVVPLKFSFISIFNTLIHIILPWISMLKRSSGVVQGTCTIYCSAIWFDWLSVLGEKIFEDDEKPVFEFWLSESQRNLKPSHLTVHLSLPVAQIYVLVYT